MKTQNRIMKSLVVVALLLFVTSFSAFAQVGSLTQTGNQTVCVTGVAEPYGVALNTGSTYVWTVTGGASGTDWVLTPNNNLATVMWNNAGSYTLNVEETNASGCTAGIVSITITVNPRPTPTISGNTPICLNKTEVYTTEAGMNEYVWTVDGGTIDSGGNTNAVTITWNVVGNNKSVKVNYKNANQCTAAAATNKDITVNALPNAVIYHN